MHTSDTALSDWAANSVESAAARLARCAALLARSLSLSCSHAAFLQALRARNPPWARASSLTPCTHASVPIKRTSAPWTALAWMTTSPEGTLPKLKPLSTNHLSTRSFTTSVLSAEGWLRALRPPAGGFPPPAVRASGSPRPPLRRVSFPDAPGTRPFGGSLAGLGSRPQFLSWPVGVSHLPPS